MNYKTIVSTVMAVAVLSTLNAEIHLDFEDDAAPVAKAKYKVALIVQNHAQGELGVPMAALASQAVAQLAGNGFEVVNPHDVIGKTQNVLPSGEPMPEMSAQALAQSTGAQGAIVLTVLDRSQIAIGKEPIAKKFGVRLSASLMDAGTGAAVCSSTVSASEQYASADAAANGPKYVQKLLFAATGACVKRLGKKTLAANWKPSSQEMVTVYFGCNVLGAVLKVDGQIRGICPMELKVPKRSVRLNVSYPPYYKDLDDYAVFTDGQTFPVVLQLTPEGEKQRMRALEYESKRLKLERKKKELAHSSRLDELDYEKTKAAIASDEKERCELFAKQLELADTMLERYTKSGETDDYVRRIVADGTSVYWRNSYGRVVITNGSGGGASSPGTNIGDIVTPPTPGDAGKSLKELLSWKPRVGMANADHEWMDDDEEEESGANNGTKNGARDSNQTGNLIENILR